MITLELFAYENYSKFRGNRAGYIDLRPPQLKKLKMISVADHAQKSNNILIFIISYKIL